jgi:hypothetical protein
MSKELILGKRELELAKKISNEIWATYDDKFGYATEKQEKNNSVSTDIPDNIWFFWGQFDSHNQEKFWDKVVHSDDVGSVQLQAWVAEQIQKVREASANLRELGIEL